MQQQSRGVYLFFQEHVMWYGPRCDVIYVMYAQYYFLIFHNFHVDESSTGRSHMVVLSNLLWPTCQL
jgi:hypothetical protein